MLWIITGILTSYIIGSIPTAYIFGKLLKGVDIRNFGSGNVGATNASRLLGKKLGTLVLILDILKGIISVILLGSIISHKLRTNQELILLLIGFGCITGHIWTIFLNFKGGKGVATTLGVMLGLAIKIAGLWLVLSLVILTWVVTFLVIRIVSVSSVFAAVAFPVFAILFKHSTTIILSSILISFIVILKHASNLKRLFEGKEPRVNFKK